MLHTAFTTFQSEDARESGKAPDEVHIVVEALKSTGAKANRNCIVCYVRHRILILTIQRCLERKHWTTCIHLGTWVETRREVCIVTKVAKVCLALSVLR